MKNYLLKTIGSCGILIGILATGQAQAVINNSFQTLITATCPSNIQPIHGKLQAEFDLPSGIILDIASSPMHTKTDDLFWLQGTQIDQPLPKPLGASVLTCWYKSNAGEVAIYQSRDTGQYSYYGPRPDYIYNGPFNDPYCGKQLGESQSSTPVSGDSVNCTTYALPRQ